MTKTGISVTAQGEASVAPDTAVISFAVSGTGKQLAPTRDEVNRRSSAVLAKVRELGIAEPDLNAPDVGVHPEYDYSKGQRLVGYRVERQMTVKVRELERLGDVLDNLMRAGANEIRGTQMSAADPSAAEHEALRSAVAAARRKAEVVAAAGGVTLGSLTRIEEEATGGPPLPMGGMLALAEATSAPTEVTAGDLTVIRRVRAWYSIA